jgi:hypothetical protein
MFKQAHRANSILVVRSGSSVCVWLAVELTARGTKYYKDSDLN